jgi:Ni,Fe-hydrogenase I cytochrome b subunit
MAYMEFRRQYVFDAVHRLIHFCNALAIVLLLATGEMSRQSAYSVDTAVLRSWHVWLGKALVLGLVARLVWGLAGTRYSRLTLLWRPYAWREAARSGNWFAPPVEFGPHVPATAAYLAVYVVLLVLAGTGFSLLAIKAGQGPLAPWLAFHVEFKSAQLLSHVWVSRLLWGFVLAHIAALIWHEKRHGTPLAQAMVSGYQYLPEEKT